MDTKSSVDWFYGALDQLVEDDELEASGHTIELFFDTADVYDALIGMLAFYTEDLDFDLRSFAQRCTLVRCLAARGWLGPFSMLPPHQVEFLTLIQLDMTAPTMNLHGLAREFLQKVKATYGNIKGLAEGETLDPAAVSEYVRQQAGSAATFFKAIECIRGSWQQRLARWRRSERLRISADNLDYAALLQSELFSDLKDALDQKRPGKASNNFADAAAIAVLIEMTRQHISGKSKVVPRFFASRQLFHETLETAGAIPLLTYPTAHGSTSSILRDAEYFLVRSVFRPPHQLRQEMGIEPVPAADLREIHAQLGKIRTATGELTENALAAIELGGRPLRDVIRDLRQLSFLETVWLSELAAQDVLRAVRELDRAATSASDPEIRRRVEIELRGVQVELADSVQRYRIAHSLWVDLEKNMDALRTLIRETPASSSLDWATHFGLIRFSIPSKQYQAINRLCAALLNDSPSIRKQGRGQVVSAFYHVYTGQFERTEVFTAAAILWIAGLNHEIVRMLADKYKGAHISITLIYAAALIRLRKPKLLQRGLRVLERIEAVIENSPSPRPEEMIGSAYLHFHIWQNSGHYAFWRTDQAGGDVPPQQTNAHIVRAIEFAKAAYYALPDNDLRRVYALNQWVYYMVEGGDPSYQSPMLSAARELARYKESQSHEWQYRYDDTLARFFHRLAVTTSSGSNRRKLFEMAQQHIDYAWAMAHGDREIENYRTVLEVTAATIGVEDNAQERGGS